MSFLLRRTPAGEKRAEPGAADFRPTVLQRYDSFYAWGENIVVRPKHLVEGYAKGVEALEEPEELF